MLAFAAVGLGGYGVSLSVITLLAPHLGHAPAYAPAWLLAATCTYFANRRLTFRCRHRPSWREWGWWLSTQALGGLIGWGCYAALLWLLWPVSAALAASTLIGAVWNYTFGRQAVRAPERR